MSDKVQLFRILDKPDIPEQLVKKIGSFLEVSALLVGDLVSVPIKDDDGEDFVRLDVPKALLPADKKEIINLVLKPEVAKFAINNYFEAYGRVDAADGLSGTFEIYTKTYSKDTENTSFDLEVELD